MKTETKFVPFLLIVNLLIILKTYTMPYLGFYIYKNVYFLYIFFPGDRTISPYRSGKRIGYSNSRSENSIFLF